MAMPRAFAGRALAGLALIALAIGACSSGATLAPAASGSPAAASVPASSPGASSGGGRYGGGGAASGSAAPGGAVVVGTATTSLGPVLTGEVGLTLYTHAGDSATSSTCTGGCAAAWPPLTVASGTQATAGPGVTGTLGTLTRADGTIQVTYNGLPLYYWKSDSQQGDVTGQGVNGFSVTKP